MEEQRSQGEKRFKGRGGIGRYEREERVQGRWREIQYLELGCSEGGREMSIDEEKG